MIVLGEVPKEKTKEEKCVCSNLTGKCSGYKFPLREWKKQDFTSFKGVKKAVQQMNYQIPHGTVNVEQPFRVVLDEAIQLSPHCPRIPPPPVTGHGLPLVRVWKLQWSSSLQRRAMSRGTQMWAISTWDNEYLGHKGGIWVAYHSIYESD